ncbi:MAG: hypothetical protein SynsKO_10660 [Synoicihabitans sp.]
MNFNKETYMKTTLIALTAIAALTFTPRPAHALGDKEAALLGGLLGGVIIGAAIDDAFDSKHHRTSSRYRGRDYDRGYEHHAHGPSCGCNTCRSKYSRHKSSGYWTYRNVKVWVPGRSSYHHDECGRRIRHYERGYWTYRKEKVWVSSRGRW